MDKYGSLVLAALPERILQCSSNGPMLQCWRDSPLYTATHPTDFPEITFPEHSFLCSLLAWMQSSKQYGLFPSSFLLRPQNFEEIIRRNWANQHYAFDVVVSDKIGPHRPHLPDTRHEKCRHLQYDVERLPNVSIVVTYYNEAASTLIRMINGIYERTPAHLLHEILLINDQSDAEVCAQSLLEESIIIFQWSKVKSMSTTKREGLIRARNFGASRATGQVILFLDSHCEVNVGWLEPLLSRIADDRTRVVSPIVDHISPATFEYEASVICRGGFDWMLNFQWLYFSSEFYSNPDNHVKAFKTPAISGGLFAVDRDFFHRIGALDDGMDIWGGENIEFSIRVWLCGGSLEILPCSRVGHVFRVYRPYSDPQGGNTLERNSARTVRTWLDEFGSKFFDYKPEAKGLDVGDIDYRLAIRQRLNCHNFQWYLRHVFPELENSE